MRKFHHLDTIIAPNIITDPKGLLVSCHALNQPVKLFIENKNDYPRKILSDDDLAKKGFRKETRDNLFPLFLCTNSEPDEKADITICCYGGMVKHALEAAYEILLEELSDDEKDYFIINEAYKNYISQYSKEYIEMSEWYYGPELPYKIYLKEFRKDKQTYLDDKESIKELYSLFMFYGLLQYYLPSD